VKGLVVIFLVSLLLTWVASQARKRNPTKAGDELQFPRAGCVHCVYGGAHIELLPALSRCAGLSTPAESAEELIAEAVRGLSE
jgi:hypothetical protein